MDELRRLGGRDLDLSEAGAVVASLTDFASSLVSFWCAALGLCDRRLRLWDGERERGRLTGDLLRPPKGGGDLPLRTGDRGRCLAL